MTQASRMFSVFALISAFYYVALNRQLPLSDTVQNDIVPVLPYWALVSFGAYLLGKLGWGVMTFNDVPNAHKELLREIEVAREELRKKGVDVD